MPDRARGRAPGRPRICHAWGAPNPAHRCVSPSDRLGTAKAAMAGDTSVPVHDSEIRLTLPARPENVAVVRHVLGALADAVRLAPDLANDMRLAVTEACTNVVRHAYRG